MTRLVSVIFASLVTTAFALGTPAAFAAGGGSPAPSQPSQPSPKKLKCKTGYVVKIVLVNGKKVKKCVEAVEGVLPDNELYGQGRMLAKEGEYDWALNVLNLIRDKNNPHVLNYIGYSHRKAGRLETGIAYYRKALAINPDFVLAREYLGEGYVAAGRVDLARIELNEIKARCGTTCEEFKDLSAAIELAVN